MDRRSQRIFLLLVLVQMAHSVEEYLGELFTVFAPAAFISSLVGTSPALGFALVNAALVAAGLLVYLGPVRRGGVAARAWAWPWVALETANGAGHLVLAGVARGYFPGVLTAPFLLFVSGWLGLRLWRSRGERALG